MPLIPAYRSLHNVGANRDAHNERIKLIAVALNAAALASLFGGVFGPLFDSTKTLEAPQAGLGVVLWAAFFLAALKVLGYIKGKD